MTRTKEAIHFAHCTFNVFNFQHLPRPLSPLLVQVQTASTCSDVSYITLNEAKQSDVVSCIH